MLLKKHVLAALFLALSFNAHSQTDIGGVHVKTFVEDFDYETMTGTIRVESFVEKDIKKPSDIVLVVDVSHSMGVTREIYTFYSQRLGYEQLDDGVYYVRHTDGKYYKISQYSGSGDYRGYQYKVGTKTYTVARDGDSNTKYDGPFYKMERINRLDELKTALNSFVNAIAANTSTEKSEIAIVSYSSTVNRVLDLTSVSNSTTIKTAIKNLTAASGEGTYIDLAVEEAADIIGTDYDPLREKVVIVFTDGQPNSASNTPDWGAADNAIGTSKGMKDSGVTVFTVGILDEEATSDERMETMMNFMSSKYPEATSLTSSGTSVTGTYYFNSPDCEELDDAYSDIAGELNGWTLDFDENTEMKDAFLSDIEITTDESKIKAYTADCSGYSSNSLTFSNTLADLSGLDIEVVTDPGTGKQSIAVDGFDFTENQCYRQRRNYSFQYDYFGKQLVLKIPFTYSPTADHLDDDRFTVAVNDDSAQAGMFVGERRVAKAMSSGLPFASLIIHKDGLIENESTIFTIERQKSGTETANTHVNRVVLTGTSEDGTTRISHTQRMLDPEATYVVKEHAGWSWTYKPTETVGTDGFVTKTKEMTASGTTPYLIFENTKYAEDDLPRNAEDFNN